jgi:L-alanine-DL-glutamate epimerase-like enolase superfamily enzyme
MKAGGIRGALRILRIAEGAGIRCMIGCMLESRIAITAAACVAAASSSVRFCDLDGFTFHAVDPCHGGVRASGGMLHLPESPGLGVEVDPAVLSRCESARVE